MFFQLLNGQVNDGAVSSLGETWEIESLVQKYHASCHFTHSPIEASLGIVKKKGLSAKDIKSIRIYISQMAMDVAGKNKPHTGLDGKFSIPYCVASALLRGETGIQAFTHERINDPKGREFMKKISLAVDQEMSWMGARVEVEIHSGSVYSEFIYIFE